MLCFVCKTETELGTPLPIHSNCFKVLLSEYSIDDLQSQVMLCRIDLEYQQYAFQAAHAKIDYELMMKATSNIIYYKKTIFTLERAINALQGIYTSDPSNSSNSPEPEPEPAGNSINTHPLRIQPEPESRERERESQGDSTDSANNDPGLLPDTLIPEEEPEEPEEPEETRPTIREG